MSFDFYQHILVLVGIIIALTIFKVANLKPFNAEGADFDWKKLLIGLSSNFMVLLGVALVYFLGETFGEDIAAITVGETTITIHAALDVLMLSTIGVYGSKLIKNFREYFGLTEVKYDKQQVGSEEEEDLEVQNTFNDELAMLEDFDDEELEG